MDGSPLFPDVDPRRRLSFVALVLALCSTMTPPHAVANSLEIPPALTAGAAAAGVTAGEIRNTASAQESGLASPDLVQPLPITLRRPLKRTIVETATPEAGEHTKVGAAAVNRGNTAKVIDVIPNVPEGNIIRPRSAGANTNPVTAVVPAPSTGSTTVVLADPKPEIGSAPTAILKAPSTAVPDNPMLTIAARALEKIGGGIPEKVQYARTVANAGDVEGARAMCQALMSQAAQVSSDQALARNCVHFDVPLVKLRQLMKESRMRDANRLIDDMLKWVGNVPEYRDYLLSVREITAKRAAQEDPKAAEQTIMNVVQSVLERYRAEQGRFPLSYAELNTALPADAPPLTEYDIVSYHATENAFTVKLQARKNPLEVLSLHKTGLIE